MNKTIVADRLPHIHPSKVGVHKYRIQQDLREFRSQLEWAERPANPSAQKRFREAFIKQIKIQNEEKKERIRELLNSTTSGSPELNRDS